jgi:hypothetical protein
MQNFLKTLVIAIAATLPCLPAHAACEGYPKELRTMVSADQALRARLDFSNMEDPAQQKIMTHMGMIDRANTARLKVLFARCGFPDQDRHGERAQSDAWLLVQHADHDVAFQKQTLKLLEKTAAERNEPVGRNFAYLSDRVAVAEHRPQLYGTQLMSPAEQPCNLDFNLLDDRQKVEARRAALGMPPLDIYKQMVIKNANCQPAAQEDKSVPPPSATEGVQVTPAAGT